jgi:hypothetical protein
MESLQLKGAKQHGRDSRSQLTGPSSFSSGAMQLEIPSTIEMRTNTCLSESHSEIKNNELGTIQGCESQIYKTRS